MTVDEYALETAKRLREARTQSDASDCFEEAERTLTKSDITGGRRKDFWSQVHVHFNRQRLLVERQENSSLHKLIQHIEAELAAKEAAK